MPSRHFGLQTRLVEDRGADVPRNWSSSTSSRLHRGLRRHLQLAGDREHADAVRSAPQGRGELGRFEARVRDGTAPIKVVRQRAKSDGTGALDFAMRALLSGCLALSVFVRHRRGAALRGGVSPGKLRASRGKRFSASARS